MLMISHVGGPEGGPVSDVVSRDLCDVTQKNIL